MEKTQSINISLAFENNVVRKVKMRGLLFEQKNAQ